MRVLANSASADLRLFANDVVVIDDGGLVVFRPVVPLGDIHEVSSLGAPNGREIVSSLRRFFALGILEEKIFESLPGKNECGKILGARGQTELHVNIRNLVEGIIADIAVRIFVENLLVGLARFLDLLPRSKARPRLNWVIGA